MLDVPMARRQRGRTRARRAQDAASRHPATARPVERDYGAGSRGVHRTARVSRSGYARAVGEPSQSLEKAAVLERGYIAKDFRRLAVVIVVSVIVLIIAGYLESTFIK
jgi:hypothetical protein